MKKLVNNVFIAFLAMMSFPAFAQEVGMADAMRSSGKIYVVVAIVLIILIGLIMYLFLLDRKVRRLEKQLRNED